MGRNIVEKILCDYIFGKEPVKQSVFPECYDRLGQPRTKKDYDFSDNSEKRSFFPECYDDRSSSPKVYTKIRG